MNTLNVELLRGLPAVQFAVLLLLLMASGCASERGPQVLTIPAVQYAAVFDIAAEAARKEGMAPSLRDRRSGVIETQPQFAGTLVEPWRVDNASFAQALEHTIAHQRRKARFEFSRPGALASEPIATDDADIPPIEDLTATEGDLELRVWVYVERASTPGVRRDTWSRRMTTTATLVYPEDVSGTYWRPVARDEAYERRLLAAIEKSLR